MSHHPPPRWPFAFIGALGLLLSHTPSQAADFCVSTTTELQGALTTAAFNQTDDRILLVQGTYNGNFLYSTTASDDLEIIGGYSSGCVSRVQDPANTLLDGGGTSSVLILIARELAAKFSIDGVTLQDGISSGDGYGGGLRAETAASVSLIHSKVISNTANKRGGGLYILAGQVTLDSNVLTDNTASEYGGGGYLSANRVDLLGNQFSTNTANSYNGGGIYINEASNSSSTAVIADANEFVENRAGAQGGGAYFYIFGTVTLTDNTFRGQTAGGVYMYSIGTATLTGNSFTNNQTTGSYYDGGGVNIDRSERATLTQNTFTGNTSGNDAGGLYLDVSSSLTLSENVFSQNTATQHGAGAYVTSADQMQLTRNQFTTNTSQESGGGVYVYGYYSNITLTENAFSGNSALEHGGAVRIREVGSSDNLINLINNRIFDNEAGLSGGGLNLVIDQASRISLVSNALLGNSAGDASPDALGGGIYLYANAGTLQLTNNTLVQNTAPSGGGVALSLEGEGSSVGANLRNNLFWANQASPAQDIWINNDVDGDFAFYPVTLLYNNFNQAYGSGIQVTIPVPIDTTNFDAVNPQFVDITNDDLNLSNASLMVNAGDPTTSGLPATDVDGHPRLVGQVVDIGAYENPTGDPDLAELNVGLEGDGAGRVTSDPEGIDCGVTCNAVFAAETEVTLTAVPDSEDMFFVGWSGGACSGTEPTCTLTLTEATVVIATFVQGYPVDTRTSSGSGTIICDPNPVPSGEDSLCTARPASGYGFTAWSGDCNRIQNHYCTLTSVMSRKSVTASFTSTTDLTASQAVDTDYVPGGLLTVTGQFNDTSGAEARGLTWLPELPEGWTVASASGDGSPQVSDNEILFSGNLTLPINFSYQIRAPQDARGDQQIAATLSYQSADMTNAVTLTAAPDPLEITQLPVNRHSADYQDPAWKIDANEANRVLVYWRDQSYHVDATTPDGYAQGIGNINGNPHSADYRDPQWRIDTFEVNRVLGYWRAPSYYAQPQGDDGYAPGELQPSGISAITPLAEEVTAPQATQAAGADYYTPGTTLTITNTIGQSGDDPLLNLIWVPALPNDWTLTGVSGPGSPEISPTGTEILFTASNELSLPLTFSYSVQVPDTASGNQEIRAEFTYQRLGMINPANAPATPNPLVLGDTDTGNACSTGLITLTAPVTSGIQAQRSESAIQVAGSVTVASGAGLELTAPRIAFDPGFQVASGGRLTASSAAVSCSAASVRAARASSAAARVQNLPATPAAPVLISQPEALPVWLQQRLAWFDIEADALTVALLDADNRWLILETTQALYPEDRNAASDIYRLDLLSDRLELLSVAEDGTAGNGPSRDPAADTLGEQVVFSSEADNLVPGDVNGVSDLFLRDRAFGQTTGLTVLSEQASAHPALDADGIALVYDQRTAAGARHVLGQALADGAAAEPLRLSEPASAGGGSADARLGISIDAHHPAISADGRFLAYLRHAQTAAGTPSCAILIRDLADDDQHSRFCPSALADASEQARASFSPDGRELNWQLPGQEASIRLVNPLAD